jgi:phage terminase small subunit
MFLPNLLERENFNISHLEGLKVLCDSYMQLDDVVRFVHENGYTYKTYTTSGEVRWVKFPQVDLMSKIKTEIFRQSLYLGLYPKKDKAKLQDFGGKDEEEWE